MYEKKGREKSEGCKRVRVVEKLWDLEKVRVKEKKKKEG